MDITNIDEVKKFIEEVGKPQNVQRKELVTDGHRIAQGDLEFFVKKRLQELWKDSYKWFRNPNASLTKKVLQRIGKAYDEAPERVLSNDEKTDYYASIISSGDGSLDNAMVLFDHTYILDHYAALWVSPVQRDDGQTKYIFRALHQGMFDRKVNTKTLETEAVIVSMSESINFTNIYGDGVLTSIQDEKEDSDNLHYYALWTKENHVLVAHNTDDNSLELVPIEGNENMVNPAGVIPFVFLQDGDTTSLPPRPSLPFNDVELNSCKAVLLTGCDVRALGKLLVKHPANQKIPKELYDSPFTFLDLPQTSDPDAAETTAEYINDSTNVNDFKEVVNDYELSLLEDEAIINGQIGNVKFTSAEDRELALKSENDRIGKNQAKYADIEQAAYEIVKRYEEGRKVYKLTDETVSIRYPKQQPVKSRSQILDEIEKEIKLGTIEPWEKHIRLNPNMTRKEAEEKEERIQESQRQNIGNIFNANNETENDLQPEPEEGTREG